MACASAAPAQHIGLLVPPAETSIVEGGTWHHAIAFAKSVATHLGVELTVAYANDQTAIGLSRLHQLVGGKTSVDALVVCDFDELSKHVTSVCRQRKIPYIYYGNMKDGSKSSSAVGKDFCIGAVLPDYGAAAADSIRFLQQAATQLPNVGDSGTWTLCGIGDELTSMSYLEVTSIVDQLAPKEGEDMHVGQVVYANGTEEDAHRKAIGLLHRYPECRALWLGTEAAFAGARQALSEKGLTGGRDVALGGIPLSPIHAKALESGELSSCTLGVSLAAGWAVLVMVDSLPHLDTLQTRQIIRYPLHVVTKETLHEWHSLLHPTVWHVVRFSSFSRFSSDGNGTYDFDLTLFRGLTKP